MKGLSLRQKSLLDLVRRVTPLRATIKQWFYHAGMKFLQSHELNEEQEKLLEEMTDFFIENLDTLEEDAKTLEKAQLGPVQLPGKKRVKRKVKV